MSGAPTPRLLAWTASTSFHARVAVVAPVRTKNFHSIAEEENTQLPLDACRGKVHCLETKDKAHDFVGQVVPVRHGSGVELLKVVGADDRKVV